MLKKILPFFIILAATLSCLGQEVTVDQPADQAVYDTTYNPDDEIFTVVEESPGYIGGDIALIKYLQENIKYPHLARESRIEGTVFITFIVEKSGRVNDVKVLRGIGGGCDEEAVRVIKSMPRWKAGKQRGKPVRVQFNLPIKFNFGIQKEN